ncbi:recombinase family protein [Mesorhizobium sp. M7A.F.Ca.MR.245.00.0.0]|uniref:recombinase family protein n=1 Tax=Mesorhizobium sp. M7A.F.Ca.MR.245.00.0.0 TaxID=2496778 RepID=UPI000FCCDCF6|nr:recombinase family protein [Mesorhizobium sp. M7A.F.Ca.MR.245.00.0.0]RUV18894.1 recombinase family protein [Mesorhizobium sp. M7A.F.Ca.MR.245.00.0.0]RUV51046.1 recombinase family protein [Mesorhizobium sp. M7A.F.Ca.MR.228.00.0.0]
MITAVAYLRTSSRSNLDGDSGPRQRQAIEEYAKRNGIEVVEEFYDEAVKGTDHIDTRPGFQKLLDYIAGNGARLILVENVSRFSRDLIVQETGHKLLQNLGYELIPVDAPDHFTDATETAVLIRQILGAVAQFEKAQLVAKLKGARDRASKAAGRRVEGNHGYRVDKPDLIKEAKRLARKSPKSGKARSLREIAAELAQLGHTTAKGQPFSASQVQRLIGAGE